MSEPVRHDYLSTACRHNLHGRCRLDCKFCGVHCRCSCHQSAPGDDDRGRRANALRDPVVPTYFTRASIKATDARPGCRIEIGDDQ